MFLEQSAGMHWLIAGVNGHSSTCSSQTGTLELVQQAGYLSEAQ